MRKVVLRLRVDPASGRREVVIDYESDADALPMEHEDEHRRLAERVVAGGLRSGKVEVGRGGPGGEAPAIAVAEPEAEAAAVPAGPGGGRGGSPSR